jgi:transglutaminase-like putative cysteine protease
MTKYRVVHNNHYSFDQGVNHCRLEARLKPVDNKNQRVEFSQFVLRPLATGQHSDRDKFGNHVDFFEIKRGLRSFSLSAIHTVTTLANTTVDLAASSPWEQVADIVQNKASFQTQYLDESASSSYITFNQAMTDYAQRSFVPGRILLEAAFDLMQRIHQDFQYAPGTTAVATTAIDAFELKRGVCQDFTHIAIACLRSLGLPVRYVSGYVDTKASSDKPHRVAADVSHAWFSVFDPKFDWVDFDPTNNTMPGESYVTLAHGRDYDDVAPLKGQTDSHGQHSLKVNVDMTAVPANSE